MPCLIIMVSYRIALGFPSRGIDFIVRWFFLPVSFWMDDDSAVMETHSREFACASRTILGSLGERHCIVYV